MPGTLDALVLIALSFLTSACTATVGLGGGIVLRAVMPSFLPAAAVIPVHGAVQVSSNLSRIWFGRHHAYWPIFWAFLAGSVIGAASGTQLVVRFSPDNLPLILGSFILLVTWLPVPQRAFRVPGHFTVLGLVQTVLSLFVGATGPLTNAFLLRERLERDVLVVTHALFMTATHLLKVVVFGVAGFAFAPYLPLIGGTIVAVTAGSYAGTWLRGRLPERLFRAVLKALVTVLALRMIVAALMAG